MSKFRFREYDALGLRKKVPGDQVPSAHHVSKRKQKEKDVEVVFDVKDYKEYVTGFRKRKQQRRLDAQKQIKDKQRLERNQTRSEKRTKLKEHLGLADNYGIEASSDDDEADEQAKPQSVTVYQGDGGLTTTVTTMALESSEDEQPATSGEDEEAEDGDREGGGRAARPGPGSSRNAAVAGAGGRGGKQPTGKQGARLEKKPKQRQGPGGGKQQVPGPRGGVTKGGKKGDAKRQKQH